MPQPESLCVTVKDAAWHSEDSVCRNEDPMQPNKQTNKHLQIKCKTGVFPILPESQVTSPRLLIIVLVLVLSISGRHTLWLTLHIAFLKKLVLNPDCLIEL